MPQPVLVRTASPSDMSIANLIIYFVTGGLVTTVIVVLEQTGKRTLSELATLIPVFTLVAYFLSGRPKVAKRSAGMPSSSWSVRLSHGCHICSWSHISRRR